jgi:hypothetical protein
VLLELVLACLDCASLSMPHRWSPEKLANRRALAGERGYLLQRLPGMNYVSVPSALAPRAKRMVKGLAAVQHLEVLSGAHRRSANDLLQAVGGKLAADDAVAFAKVSRDANAAKHASFLRPPVAKRSAWADLNDDDQGALASALVSVTQSCSRPPALGERTLYVPSAATMSCSAPERLTRSIGTQTAEGDLELRNTGTQTESGDHELQPYLVLPPVCLDAGAPEFFPIDHDAFWPQLFLEEPAGAGSVVAELRHAIAVVAADVSKLVSELPVAIEASLARRSAPRKLEGLSAALTLVEKLHVRCDNLEAASASATGKLAVLPGMLVSSVSQLAPEVVTIITEVHIDPLCGKVAVVESKLTLIEEKLAALSRAPVLAVAAPPLPAVSLPIVEAASRPDLLDTELLMSLAISRLTESSENKALAIMIRSLVKDFQLGSMIDAALRLMSTTALNEIRLGEAGLRQRLADLGNKEDRAVCVLYHIGECDPSIEFLVEAGHALWMALPSILDFAAVDVEDGRLRLEEDEGPVAVAVAPALEPPVASYSSAPARPEHCAVSEAHIVGHNHKAGQVQPLAYVVSSAPVLCAPPLPPRATNIPLLPRPI